MLRLVHTSEKLEIRLNKIGYWLLVFKMKELEAI